MATELIAIGTTETSSSDVVLASGDHAVFFLKGTLHADARAYVEVKASDGTYTPVAELRGLPGVSAVSVIGPATFRVRRMSNVTGAGTINSSFGVEQG